MQGCARQAGISIHALREEGDAVHRSDYGQQPISIHALREEGDTISITGTCLADDFYPRPPRGGRPARASISLRPSGFLSTPSARRATDLVWQLYQRTEISIHALREEGDCGGL